LTINYSFITMAYIYVVVARATKCLACDRNLGFVSITVVRRDTNPTAELVHVSTETFLCTNGPAHSGPGARLGYFYVKLESEYQFQIPTARRNWYDMNSKCLQKTRLGITLTKHFHVAI
jgi:hypothetical protein